MPEHTPGSFEHAPGSREQGTASSEHAIMQEITAPLATLPDDPVPVVADVDFPLVLRGYDRIAVDAYVRRTSQLVAELQATRSPEAAVRRALERVGEEVSGILQRAHETAERITAKSRGDAEDRLEVARQEAAALTAAAERRVKELDTETDRIWAERHRIVEDARLLASELLTLADSAAARFPAEEPPAGAQPPFAAAHDEPAEVFGEAGFAAGQERGHEDVGDDFAGTPSPVSSGFGSGLTEDHDEIGGAAAFGVEPPPSADDPHDAPTRIGPIAGVTGPGSQLDLGAGEGEGEGAGDGEEGPEGFEHGPEAPGEPR
jgi:hypothetical protein